MKNRKTREEQRRGQTTNRTDWDTSAGCSGVREYEDLMAKRPWMDVDEKYRLEFDPMTIAAQAVTRMERYGDGPTDLVTLIGLGVELGDDLDAIARLLNRTAAAEFRRLRVAYGVVSRPPSQSRRTGTAMTLSRLCSAFPTHACWYLHDRPALPPRGGLGVLSPEAMAALAPGYPPAMATPAFAFLVPNRGDAYCAQLMKAHMLHEYASLGPQVDASHTTGPDDHKDKIVALVVKRTLAAVFASCVPYAVQTEFLTGVGLVRAVPCASGSRAPCRSRTVASEQVVAAARAWDQVDSNKLTKLFAKFYR